MTHSVLAKQEQKMDFYFPINDFEWPGGGGRSHLGYPGPRSTYPVLTSGLPCSAG
jgi:hypothetical protein